MDRGRINEEILQGRRADYGEQIVVTLSRQLVAEHGEGFSEKNLRRMRQFAEVFPNEPVIGQDYRGISGRPSALQPLMAAVEIPDSIWEIGLLINDRTDSPA